MDAYDIRINSNVMGYDVSASVLANVIMILRKCCGFVDDTIGYYALIPFTNVYIVCLCVCAAIFIVLNLKMLYLRCDECVLNTSHMHNHKFQMFELISCRLMIYNVHANAT